jgi:mono/diheme cytochrome c family protein
MRAAAAAALTLVAAAPLLAPARTAADALVNPYEGNEAARAEGRSLFNQYCSHCHAPNAMNPDPPKDLRRLRIRYGDAMRETFYTTVTHGRPDKGMPNWSGVLDDPTFWKIYSFLESVQSQP